ncbi:creatininase family protein [Nocardia aurantia]|uniref:Putative mycofactocin system creatinine amidohydrolase family protein MftE n=1 Tax=Nocardia aurantia TaxID=2585199 RepID=A0A7K0DYZ4_9NOCA|nr:creatininase family protein [Nocardia aurantia]MQY30502.1 putative mycofactocin system creatinine amidohydrolase family protein MftE [Nocardia aurantia]
MSRIFRLAHLTTTDVAAIDKSDAVVVQPIGAVEQHGPHLPLITDALHAETIACAAVESLPDDANVWVLPTLHYGKSTEHLGRAGTIAMSAATLMAVCTDLGDSLAASGFRKLVFVNGHGGQPGLLEVVARDIRHRTGLEVFPVMPMRFPPPPEVDPAVDGFDIHGGFGETSVMLAIAPELVHPDRGFPDGQEAAAEFARYRHLTLEGVLPTAWLTDDISASGTVGDPTAASAEIGRLLVDSAAAHLAEALLEVRAFAFPALGGAR